VTLNARQKKFAEEYWISGHGTQSAINAGYSKKSAHTQANLLLKNIKVQEKIKELENESRTLLQQQFARDAIEARKIMFNIMADDDAPDNVRLSAAKDFLDRAGYKPTEDMNINATGDMGIQIEWVNDDGSSD
jgi:phage terminase small subunit